MNCAQCRMKPSNKCGSEGYDCTAGKLDFSEFSLEENREFQNLSDALRKIHGDRLSRIEEIIQFCQELGYKKIGIAFCIGLKEEAKLAAKIFKHFFRVESACCKLGGLNKDDHGMTKINPGEFEVACNPVGQAKIMNRAGTDLNIQMGLCLGHDILFQKYSDAPVTVLAVKDRALANNPMGAVYSSYWRKKFGLD